EQLFLALVAPAPDRTDRVDHVLGDKPVTARDLGRAGLAAAERAALAEQLRTGGAVDRAIDAAAAKKRAVCRVDDGVDVERGDVGAADVDTRGADGGGQEWLRRHDDHAQLARRLSPASDSVALATTSAGSSAVRRPPCLRMRPSITTVSTLAGCALRTIAVT